MIYCDTSYLARLYLSEPGSAEVRTLCAANEIASAAHALAELPAALHRALREGRLARPAFLAVLDQFRADDAAQAFHWLPLSQPLLAGMPERIAGLDPTTYLRAADALHLACAAEHGFREVHSNDRHFLAAAPCFGLTGVNVIVS